MAFPDGGYYVMGNRHHGDWALVRCGPVGVPGTGGHGHCDALAVEVAVGGRSLLVDRGTGVYTPAPHIRNRYRSTDMHNTIRVDDTEQNPFDPARLWYMPDCARARCLRSGSNCFEGEHEGYTRLSEPVIHRRQIAYDDRSRCWEIQDCIYGPGPHRLEAFWPFDPH